MLESRSERGFSRGRRGFIGGALAAASGSWPGSSLAETATAGGGDYAGPNVVVIRFGGGVRRRETIDPDHTYAPYLRKVLVPRGTFYPDMVVDQFADVNTSHGEGTLYILTGKYEKFQDVQGKFLGARFESEVPTVFEYLRKAYAVPEHQTLIINGEDRTDEEFYSFSNHHLFGAQFRSEVLSLFRYKAFLLDQQIAAGKWRGAELEKRTKQLAEMRAKDYRTGGAFGKTTEIVEFWKRWRHHYGESGFVNARGDRLLTDLALWAMRLLRPRLVMVNYNDPDYVHWGNPSHYTRGISIIDEGLQRLVEAVEADEFYGGNTVFVVVPDCGRDTNRLVSVPFQHHFNSRSSHEIWALIFGKGVPEGQIVDRQVDQTAVAGTVGKLMGIETPHTEGGVLEEAIA